VYVLANVWDTARCCHSQANKPAPLRRTRYFNFFDLGDYSTLQNVVEIGLPSSVIVMVSLAVSYPRTLNGEGDEFVDVQRTNEAVNGHVKQAVSRLALNG
jgi:hypothetical protein